MLKGKKRGVCCPIPDTIIFKGLEKKQLFGWQCKNIQNRDKTKQQQQRFPIKIKPTMKLIAFFRINLASCTKFVLTIFTSL